MSRSFQMSEKTLESEVAAHWAITSVVGKYWKIFENKILERSICTVVLRGASVEYSIAAAAAAATVAAAELS